jgi:PTS system cellobiose-specific IIA component
MHSNQEKIKIDTNEQAIMNIIVHGGDARSSCLKAVRCARIGQFAEAEVLLKRADENLIKAHAIQTRLIQDEIRGEKNEITLLMVHAQDHLMNAIAVKDLCIELMEESRKRIELEERLKGVVFNG